MTLPHQTDGRMQPDRGTATARGAHAWMVSLTLAASLALPVIGAAQTTLTPEELRLLTQVQEIPQLLARRQLTAPQIPNPHWRADACLACHAATPTQTALALRDADANRLCGVCHDALSPHSYIHPTDMPLPPPMAQRAPQSFRDAVVRGGGNLTCLTCHDLPMQCLPARARERAFNPLFFRDGPYRDRTALCYRCHDGKAYERLNAHEQIGAQGRRREERCLVCHEHVPAAAGEPARVDFNVPGDLSALCTGCHPSIPHPGGSFSFGRKGEPNHLVVPAPGMAERMRRQARAQGIVLPLDPNTGKVYCGTCHNAHARGVLQGAAAHGADGKDRLRSPRLCEACHEL